MTKKNKKLNRIGGITLAALTLPTAAIYASVTTAHAATTMTAADFKDQFWNEDTKTYTVNENVILSEALTINSGETISVEPGITLSTINATLEIYGTVKDGGKYNILTELYDGGVIESGDFGQNVTSYGGTIKGGTLIRLEIDKDSTATTIIDGGTFERLYFEKNQNKTNSAVINNGTFGDVDCNNSDLTINNGIFNGKVILEGTINGGTFSGTVSGQYFRPAKISGGTFTETSTVNNTMTIEGGDFYGTVNNNGSKYDVAGEITGGNFYGTVTNNKYYDTYYNKTLYGEISGGTFNGEVTNNSTISDGTFSGAVTNSSDGTINGGTFNDVTNDGTISNGTFSGSVTNSSGGIIVGGVFDDEVINDGTVSGGKFNGTLGGSGTITGGDFTELTVTDCELTVALLNSANNIVIGDNVTVSADLTIGADKIIVVSGDLTVAENAALTIAPDAEIDGSGEINGSVTNNGTISGGTYNGSVINNGTISGGFFYGYISGSGIISDDAMIIEMVLPDMTIDAAKMNDNNFKYMLENAFEVIIDGDVVIETDFTAFEIPVTVDGSLTITDNATFGIVGEALTLSEEARLTLDKGAKIDAAGAAIHISENAEMSGAGTVSASENGCLVENYGTISGISLIPGKTSASLNIINGGTMDNCKVADGMVSNSGSISGGVFESGGILMNSGTVTGAEINCPYINFQGEIPDDVNISLEVYRPDDSSDPTVALRLNNAAINDDFLSSDLFSNTLACVEMLKDTLNTGDLEGIIFDGSVTIENDYAIDSPVIVNGELIVKNGTVLTIQNSVITLSEGAKLTVEEGAALKIETGKLIINKGAVLDGAGKVGKNDPFSVENHGTIADNTFDLDTTAAITITNADTGNITGGTFTSKCSINNTGTISGGNFEGCGLNNGMNDSGIKVGGGNITGGNFNTVLWNYGGDISDNVKAAVFDIDEAQSLKDLNLYNLDIDEDFLQGSVYRYIQENESSGGNFGKIVLNGDVTISADYTANSPVTVNGKLTVDEGAALSSGNDVTVSENGSVTGKGTIDADVQNGGAINSGTFEKEVHNNKSGTINDGMFNGQAWNAGLINDGKFAKPVIDMGGTISDAHGHYAVSADGKYICNLCGKAYCVGEHTYGEWENSGDHHTRTCSICGSTEKADHTWDKGKITKQPTTEETGIMTYTCTVCGATKTETIEKLEEEHKHELVLHAAVPAACTTDGSEAYWTCSGCDKMFSDENGTTEITEIRTIPALGHSCGTDWKSDETGHWHECTVCGDKEDFAAHTEDGGTVTKRPTTREKGERTYKCTVCGAVTRTEVIDKLSSSGGAGTPSRPAHPTDPTDPIAPDNDEPSIKDENGKTGWEAINGEIDSSENGNSITVDMNGASVVPGNVFDALKDKDITIVFDMGDGITWSVNGKDITSDAVSDIDFSVASNTKNIPVDVINTITGERYSIQISLAYDGELGFKAVLSIDLGSGNAGQKATLYYYNGSAFEFMSESVISADGTAKLAFTHASDYLIVIGEIKSDNNSGSTSGGGDTSEDNNSSSTSSGSDTSEDDNSSSTSSGGDTSEDNNSSSTSSGGDTSEDNNSSSTSSGDDNSDTTDSSDASQGNTEGNPSTGAAVSIIPLAAATAFLTVSIKRKKKK